MKKPLYWYAVGIAIRERDKWRVMSAAIQARGDPQACIRAQEIANERAGVYGFDALQISVTRVPVESRSESAHPVEDMTE